jgi:hypothetical protein
VVFRALVLASLAWGAILPAIAADPYQPEQRTYRIPRVTRPPKLEDFLNGAPRQAEVVITDFRQFDPGDGDPVSEPTTAYLSYDDKNLYVAFVCKDSDPGSMRIRKTKREDILNDDRVTINIDTFHDHRRSYFFDSNAYGIQMDGITTDGQGDDFSFDTLWYSEGRITSHGYVVLETIPFRSLRFSSAPKQTWGFIVARFIQRNNEWATAPHVSRRRLPQWAGQLGDLEGLEGISPGRNLQFIPYALFSRGRFLDVPASGSLPRFQSQTEARGGLDSKVVLRDAFTLDTAINPDFSQVESDEPQVTVNQRYEVYFPEKRPLFIENAGFFRTPETLFFSRRIQDPQFGARLTGKAGPWALGVLAADDRAPGEVAESGDPLHGRRAFAGVVRVQREFLRDSHVGLLATSREFASSHNRVFSLDARIRLKQGWFLRGQVIRSDTRALDGTRYSGPAYYASLSRSGRKFSYSSVYRDRSPRFRSELGYIPRVDIRQMEHFVSYRWRPEGRRILNFGPDFTVMTNWNREGRLQDWEVEPGFYFELPRLTTLRVERAELYELFERIGFRKRQTSLELSTEWLKWLTFRTELEWGDDVNYYPAASLDPFLGKSTSRSVGLTWHASDQLRFDESYLYTRLGVRTGSTVAREGASVFNNHILRSKVNYQFTRELSLRAILDYNAVLSNPALVDIERSKRVGADVLLTYLVNPGTALYAGYTDIHENLALDPTAPPYLRRTQSPWTSTGRQFFVKLSYLLRF